MNLAVQEELSFFFRKFFFYKLSRLFLGKLGNQPFLAEMNKGNGDSGNKETAEFDEHFCDFLGKKELLD